MYTQKQTAEPKTNTRVSWVIRLGGFEYTRANGWHKVSCILFHGMGFVGFGYVYLIIKGLTCPTY